MTRPLQPGDRIAKYRIVGPPGSGKSTLLQLLMRLYDVGDGAIRIDGVDLRQLKIDAVRALVSYAPQEPFLFAGTVRENITFGRSDISDAALEQAYRFLSRRRWSPLPLFFGFRHELRRIGRLQADSALLFEGVNNALKLIGDQYLARVYRDASARLHLQEWDTAILRRLETLESIYAKLHDQQTTWRMEVLEWIIILLIAVSIVLPFLGVGK